MLEYTLDLAAHARQQHRTGGVFSPPPRPPRASVKQLAEEAATASSPPRNRCTFLRTSNLKYEP